MARSSASVRRTWRPRGAVQVPLSPAALRFAGGLKPGRGTGPGPYGSAVLDDFNRTEGPPLTTGWDSVNGITNGGLQATGTTMKGAVGTAQQQWGTQLEVPAEVWATIGTVGAIISALYLDLLTGPSGAKLELEIRAPGASVPNQWSLYDRIGNTYRTGAVQQALANGDKIGITFDGTTARAWYKAAAGSWTTLITWTPDEPSYSGAISITTADIPSWDDFGGGIVSPTVGLYAPSLLSLSASLTFSPTATLTAPTRVPLDPAALTFSPTATITAPSTGVQVPLGTASLTFTPTAAVNAPTQVPLATASLTFTPTAAVSAPAIVPLATASLTFTPTIKLATYIPLDAASLTFTPTLKLATYIPLDPAALTFAPSAAVSAKTTIPLGTSSLSFTPTLNVSVGACIVSLASSALTFTPSATVKVPVTIPLAASGLTFAPTAALRAATQVSLAASSLAFSPSAVLSARGLLTLSTAALTFTDSIALSTPTAASITLGAVQLTFTDSLALATPTVTTVPLGVATMTFGGSAAFVIVYPAGVNGRILSAHTGSLDGQVRGVLANEHEGRIDAGAVGALSNERVGTIS